MTPETFTSPIRRSSNLKFYLESQILPPLSVVCPVR